MEETQGDFMKFLTAFSVLMFVLCAHAQYKFDRGEVIVLQEAIWRRLPDASGSSCQLQFLAKLTVEEVKSEEIIVRYESDRLEHPANCPNGVLLSFEPHYLDTHRDLSHEYKEKKNAINKIKMGDGIRIYSGYSVGDELEVMGWRWALLEEKVETFREGDLCRIREPSTVSVIGFYEKKKQVLFSYGNSGGESRECPNGALFFEGI